MGKGNAKFGFKSGTLPEVRQLLKKPIKPIVRPPNPNVGYAKGIPHPRGTSREQPLPKIKTVSSLISQTVKVPKTIPDLKKLTQIQKEKAAKAALRRDYYMTSLKQEESKILYKEAKAKEFAKEEEKRKAEQVYEVSEATKLTLPTIDSILEGPFMRQRTEEEKEILAAKRTANRLQNELTGKTNRAVNLLELYYESKDFIINEEQLESAIENAFSIDQNTNTLGRNPDFMQRSHNDALMGAFSGQINGKPGLSTILDQLSGKSSEFESRVHKAVQLQLKNELESSKMATQ